ncbi:MAG: argininosuccinate synthase [Eggerthellaceae bacterium]|jgi:argininosuccinate synthase
MAQKEKVVLAYSGGLDTSCCIKWLQIAKNLDVIAVVGDVGQAHDGLEKVQEKAFKMGALDCVVVDIQDNFAENFITKAIAANALYENKYPLLSALSRPAISKHLVDAAHKYGAKFIAHGCTGKGNDQVRFENSIAMLDPNLHILAPVRDWDFNTRPEEMAWAEAHGVDVPTTQKSPYSIDDNLVGRTIECGVLEDPWAEPPADIYTMTVDPTEAPDTPQYCELEFEKGIPVAVNGKKMSMKNLIATMNKIAGQNGYGRIDMIENRLVGIKSREVYECPGALALITAHKALEDLCLEREVLHHKLALEQTWAEAVYYGQWYSPLKEAIDAFMASTQTCITGTVKLKFYKGSCVAVGRKSIYSLYNPSLITYGEHDEFDHAAAAGFIEINGLSARNWAMNRKKHAAQTDAQDDMHSEGPLKDLPDLDASDLTLASTVD